MDIKKIYLISFVSFLIIFPLNAQSKEKQETIMISKNNYPKDLETAKNLASKGKYNQAIFYAKKISKKSQYYNEAQLKISEWQDEVLNTNNNSLTNNQSDQKGKSIDYCSYLYYAYDNEYKSVDAKAQDWLKNCEVRDIATISDMWVRVKFKVDHKQGTFFGGGFSPDFPVLEITRDGQQFRNFSLHGGY